MEQYPATPPSATDYRAGLLSAARAGDVDRLVHCLASGNADVTTTNASGLTALHLAAKEGRANVVVELLKRGADINVVSKKGNTPLHTAALAGKTDVVRLLVESGSNVNVQSKHGFTPLYMAAQENHLDVIRYLLSSGARQDITTEDGFTPLAVALQQGHEKVVNLLSNSGQDTGKVGLGPSGTLTMRSRGSQRSTPALHVAARKDDVKGATTLIQNASSTGRPAEKWNLIHEVTKSGFTALHVACRYGNHRVAALLIEYGADVNFTAKNNVTPLHVASKWGHRGVVRLLLTMGAKIDVRSGDDLSSLHCAARSGHDGVIVALLEKGAPIDARSKNGLTPLHMSAQGDHSDCANLMLNHGAQIDATTVDNLTPLHIAAHYGHLRTAKLLLDRNCNINALAPNGFTPLHIACKKNHIKVVELLLRYGASLDTKTESGLTPLHVAAFMGNEALITFLLEKGASPNSVTQRGETPLHYAARANRPSTAKQLLDNGAQVDAKSKELLTPLHISARQGDAATVELLLQHGAAPNAVTADLNTPLHGAAREGHNGIVTMLVDHGANMNLVNKRGFSPLHMAAKFGKLKVAVLLLDRGVDPNIEGKHKLTPLHVATHYGQKEIALLLLDRKAKPQCTAKNGFTPLHIASKRNRIEIAAAVIRHGADVKAESANGYSPLHLASPGGHLEIAALLLNNGANPNCRSKNGLAPMHLCAQEDRVPVAELLEKHGAEIDPQTKAGYTPLHTACHFGQINMILFLLGRGASVTATTRMGYTPLHQAAQMGHVIVIKALLKYKADPNALTLSGQTPLSIAENLDLKPVIDLLKNITDVVVSPASKKRKFNLAIPETMQEAPMSDWEDEGHTPLAPISEEMEPTPTMRMTPSGRRLAPPPEGAGGRTMPVMRRSRETSPPRQLQLQVEKEPTQRWTWSEDDFYDTMQTTPVGEERYARSSYSLTPRHILDELSYMNESSMRDEMKYPSGEDILNGSPQVKPRMAKPELLTPTAGMLSAPIAEKDGDTLKPPKGHILGIDGGIARAPRPQNVRVIVPRGSLMRPATISCRLVPHDRLKHPPPLREGEAFATRIVELTPPTLKFLKPVIVEVPHFASLRDGERAIKVLRSDDGLTWQTHVNEPSTKSELGKNAVRSAIKAVADSESGSVDDICWDKVTHIFTPNLPRYFALINQVYQQTGTFGPKGGVIQSTVDPHASVVVPPGSLNTATPVSLEVLPVRKEVVSDALGDQIPQIVISPVVSVEPLSGTFYEPVTLSVPYSKDLVKPDKKRKAEDDPKLHLIAGTTENPAGPTCWRDVTDAVPMTFSDDEITFTPAIAALRYMVMSCPPGLSKQRPAEELAAAVHKEAVKPPFAAKFVVFAKRLNLLDGQLKVYCLTDEDIDTVKTLEEVDGFVEVARSKDVEVFEAKPQYLQLAGNLSPVVKPVDPPLNLPFHPFQANKVPVNVRVVDIAEDARAALSFTRTPAPVQKDGTPVVPICRLPVMLPHKIGTESLPGTDADSKRRKTREQRPASDDDYTYRPPGSDQPNKMEWPSYDEEPEDKDKDAKRRKTRQQGAAGDDEYRPPGSDQPNKLEWPALDGEPENLALPIQLAYAAKELSPRMPEEIVMPQESPQTWASRPEEPGIGGRPTAEGEIQSRQQLTESQHVLEDGSVVKTHTITTTYFRPLTELPRAGEIPKKSHVGEKIVGIEIEEDVVCLPPGVIEPYGSNVETDVNTKRSEDLLPDGVPVKKSVTTLTAHLKSGTDGVPEGKLAGSQASGRRAQQPKPALERVEELLRAAENVPLSSDGSLIGDYRNKPSTRLGPVQTKTEVHEEDEKEKDGSTVKHQTTTTQHIVPVIEAVKVGNNVVENVVAEKLIMTDIRETITKIPPGVRYTCGKDIETEATEECFEDMMPDGSLLRRKLITVDVKKILPENIQPSEIGRKPRKRSAPRGWPSKVSKKPEQGPVSKKAEPVSETAPGKVSPSQIPGPVLSFQFTPDGFPTPTSQKMSGVPEYGKVKPFQPMVADGAAKSPSPSTAGPVYGTKSQQPVVIPDSGRKRQPSPASILSPFHQPGRVGTNGRLTPELAQDPMCRLDAAISLCKAPEMSPFLSAAPLSYGSPISRTSEGAIVPRTLVKEYRRGLDDGGTVIRKVAVTERVEPSVEIPISATGQRDNAPVAGIEVEESILKLPTGIIHPSGRNVQCEATVEKSSGVLSDGTPIIRKVVTGVVQLKPAKDVAGLGEGEFKIVDGELQSRVTNLDDQYKLDDGTLVMKKMADTEYFKPVFKVGIVDGKEIQEPLREEPVGVESLQNVVELHPGVVEPFGSNVVAKVTVDNTDEDLPSGVPLKKKVVTLSVTPKDTKENGDQEGMPSVGEEPMVLSSKQLPTSNVPGRFGAPKPDKGHQEAGLPQAHKKASPIRDTAKKETGQHVPPKADTHKPDFGDIPYEVVPDKKGLPNSYVMRREGKPFERTETAEEKHPLENGGTLQHQAITRTHIQPVEEIPVVNGRQMTPKFFEEIIDRDIEEIFTELPPGISVPSGSNVECETLTERLDDAVIDGILTRKTVSKTTCRKTEPLPSRVLPDTIQNIVDDTEAASGGPLNELITPESSSFAMTSPFIPLEYQGKHPSEPKVGPTEESEPKEDDIREQTHTIQYQCCLDDGTLLCRTLAVTRRFVPTDDAQVPEGSLPLALGTQPAPEKLIDVEVEENILALPPGLIAPNNCDVAFNIQRLDTPMEDGTPVKRTVATVVVTLKEPSAAGGRTVEGKIETRTHVTEDEKNLDDGSTVKRKVMTSVRVQPIYFVTTDEDGTEVSTLLREKAIDADIDENIIELPPGVTEPYGSNCDTNITVSQLDDTLPDGTPVKHKITTMTVRLKDRSSREPSPDEVGEDAGPLRSETSTSVSEENLDDGTTIQRKIITTKRYKPVKKPGIAKVHEQLVDVNIEENVLQLPPGVIEPYARNCDNDIVVEKTEEVLPEGAIVKHKVVKMIVRLKQPGVGDGRSPQDAKLVPGQVSGGREVVGDTVKRVDMKEVEKVLPDGTLVKTKTETTRYVKPSTSRYPEVVVGAEVVEDIIQLGPGVTEPVEYPSVKKTTNVVQTKVRLPEGLVAPKTITMTGYRKPQAMDRMQPADAQRALQVAAEAPGLIRLDRATTVSAENLPDGTAVQRKVITTKSFKPVKSVGDANVHGKLVDVDVEENVLQLPPGVIEPYAKNCDNDISVEKNEEVLPDGVPAKHKLVKMVVRMKRPSVDKEKSPGQGLYDVDGPIRSETTTDVSEDKLQDGTLIQRKTITTRRFKPVRKPGLTEPVENLIDVDIEENILQLPPGVIEPYAANCDNDISVEHADEVLPDGVPVKRKTVKMIVQLRRPLIEQPTTAVARPLSGKAASDRVPSTKAVEGEPMKHVEVKETEKVRPDGTLVRTKTETSRYLKPVMDVRNDRGELSVTGYREVVVGAEVVENVDEFGPGVTEPVTDPSVKPTTSTVRSEETLPEGIVAPKIVTTTSYQKPSHLLSSAIPVTAEKMGPNDDEGTLRLERTTTLSKENLPDGSTIQRKVTTTKRFKPVKRPGSTDVQEQLIDVGIEENVLQLPAGVIEPFAGNCDNEISVTNTEEILPDGVIAKRRLVKIVVSLKPEEEEDAGPIRSETTTQASEDNLPDGTVVQRKIVTTRFFKPVRKPSTNQCREKLVDMHVDENILQLSPGVIEPYAKNCDNQISVEDKEVMQPEGVVAKHHLVKMVVSLKPTSGTTLDTVGEINVIPDKVDSGLVCKVDTKESERKLDDGTLIRTKTETTRRFMRPEPATFGERLPTSPDSPGLLIGAEVMENVEEFGPGVTEPVDDPTVTAKRWVVETKETLPEGIIAPKTVTTVCYQKPGVTRVVRGQPLGEGRKSPSRGLHDDKEPIGKLRTEKTTTMTEDNLEDGTTIQRKVITTKRFRPFKKPGISALQEQLVDVDVQENVLQLPPGVIEAYAKNCDNEISVENDEETKPDGVVYTHKLVKMVVRLKRSDVLDGKTPIMSPIPMGGEVAGGMTKRVDVKESEKFLPDGTLVRTVTETTRYLKPVTDVSIVDGTLTASGYREEVVGAEVSEDVVQLGPGLVEPFDVKDPSVKMTTSLAKTEVSLPEGIRAPKTVKTTCYEKLKGAEDVEEDAGPVRSETTTQVSEENLPDGTIVQRKIITTRYLKPVRKPGSNQCRDKLVDMHIDENILQLSPGVIEPYAQNCETDISSDDKEEVTPEGVVAKHHIDRIVVTLKPPSEIVLTTVGPNVGDVTHGGVDGDVENPIVNNVEVKESEKTLDDGTLVRTKTETTRHFKRPVPVPYGEQAPASATTPSILLGAEVVENVDEFGPGVKEPVDDPSVTVRKSVVNTKETLPEGIIAPKTVTTVSYQKPGGVAAVGGLPVGSRKSPGRGLDEDQEPEGKLRTEKTTVITEENMDDGTTIRNKVVTTRRFKPTKKPGSTGVQEQLVEVDVHEYILELPPGVIEPFAKNCENHISVENDEKILPDGVPLTHKLVRMVVRLKRPELLEGRTSIMSPLPVGGEVEGGRTKRVDVKESEKFLPDGTLVRTVTETTRYLKPVTDISVVDGALTATGYREEVVGAEVAENVVQFGPGVVEPIDVNDPCVKMTTSLAKTEVSLPEGIIAPKTLKTTCYEKLKRAEDVEEDAGPVRSETTTQASEENLPDGTIVQRKIITTRYLKPVRKPGSKQCRDKLVDMHIDENILQLSPGVIEPYAQNCETDISSDDKEEVTPEGVVAKHHIDRIVVTLKPPSEIVLTTVGPNVGDVTRGAVDGDVENPIVNNVEVKESEKTLDDGTLVRTKTETTRHFKRPVPVPYGEQAPASATTPSILLGAEVVENVDEFGPGVKEPVDDTSVTVRKSVVNTKETLPEGIFAPKTVTTVSYQKPGGVAVAGGLPGQVGSRKSPGRGLDEDQEPEGKLRTEKTTVITEENMDDGTTIRNKVVTTKRFKPTKKPGLAMAQEQLVDVDVHEYILELPPGVIEPFAKNCENYISVENDDKILPDGVPFTHKLVRMVVRMKRPELLEGRTSIMSPLPVGGEVEGGRTKRVDVKESEKFLPDGTLVRTVTETTRYLKPVTDISVVDGALTATGYREEVVGAEVAENVVQFGPGVVEPIDVNDPCIKMTTSLAKTEVSLPEGIIAPKIVKTTCYEKLKRAEDVEEDAGPVRAETTTQVSEENLPDGTIVQRKIITTRYLKPVRKPGTNQCRDKLVDMHIDENILQLSPGVIEPYAQNCETDISSDDKEEVTPEGVVAKHHIDRIVVTLKPPSEIVLTTVGPNLGDVTRCGKDGDVQSPTVNKVEVKESEKTLDDGTLVRTKTETTRHFKRPVPAAYGEQPPASPTSPSILVGAEVVENVDEFGPGVKEPVDDPTVTVRKSVVNTKETLPEGIVAPKTVTTLSYQKPGGVAVAGSLPVGSRKSPGRGLDEDQEPEGKLRTEKTTVITEEDMDDGTTIRNKVVTTKRFKPTKKPGSAMVQEQLVDVNVHEYILELPPGVIEPYAKNCENHISVENDEKMLPDGVPFTHKLVRMVVRLKRPELLEGRTSIMSPLPMGGEVEGGRTKRVDVKESEKFLPDGTLVRTVTETTRYLKPVTDISVIDGALTATGYREEVVGAEVAESVVQFGPGVVEPIDVNDPSIKMTTSVEKTEVLLPDGIKAPKTVNTISYQKPGGVGPKRPGFGDWLGEDAGPLRSDTTTKITEENLPDGSMVQRKIITTKFFKPVTKPGSKVFQEKLVGVEVDENALQLSPGVIEPYASNCDNEIYVEDKEEELSDGVVSKHHLVMVVVRLKSPSDAQLSVSAEPDKSSRSGEIKRDVDDGIIKKVDVKESERVLGDGTLVRTRTETTRRFRRPAPAAPGKHAPVSAGSLVGAEVVENVDMFGPGVTEPVDDPTVTVKRSIVKTNVSLPEGIVAPKTVTTVSYQKPGAAGLPGRPQLGAAEKSPFLTEKTTSTTEENRDDGTNVQRKVVTTKRFKPVQKPGTTEVEEQLVDVSVQENVLELPPGVIEHYAKNCENEISVEKNEETLPDGVPSTHKLVKMVVHLRPPSAPEDGISGKSGQPIAGAVEGDRTKRVDVKETEKFLPDGTLVRTITETTRYLKPVTDVSVVDGAVTATGYHEEVVGAEVSEDVVRFGPGVVEPIDLNDASVKTSSSVVNSEVLLADGITAPKTTKTTCYEKLGGAKADAADAPEVDAGPVRSETATKVTDEHLADGTTIQRKVVTTKYFKPVRKPGAKECRDKLIDVHIDENVLQLSAGVIEPYARNCENDISVEDKQEVQPDGVIAKHHLVKVVVSLKPPSDAAATRDGKPVAAVDADGEVTTNKVDVKESERVLPDGTFVRTKTETTRRLKRAKPPAKGETLVGAEVVETVDEFGPGVTEPVEDPSVKRKRTVVKTQETLPEGVRVPKTVTTVSYHKPTTEPGEPSTGRGPAGENEDLPAGLRSERTTTVTEENLEDGTNIQRKVITTKRFRPVRQPGSPDVREQLVDVDIQENVLQLPPGVIEPFAKNCENEISVENDEETKPDGVLYTHKLVKMIVRLKPSSAAEDDGHPGKPITGAVEGDRAKRVDLKETEKFLPDGTLVRTVTETTRYLKPVTDVSVVDGAVTATGYREEVIGADVSETVVQLGPGIVEPIDANDSSVRMTSSVVKTEVVLPDGIRAPKTIKTTSYEKPAGEFVVDASPLGKNPKPTGEEEEDAGPIRSESTTTMSEENLPDGATVQRKVVTTRYYKPVRKPGSADVRERLVDVDIEDNILQLPPGVIEPYARNCENEISMSNSEELLVPEGIVAKRKTVKMVVRLKRPSSSTTDSTPVQSPLTAKPPSLGPFARAVEGETVNRVDVKETERFLADGTLVRRRTETTRRMKPVTDVTVVDGALSTAAYREIVVGAEVIEDVIQFGPGVTEPVTDPSVKVTKSVVHAEETLPDGIVAPKTIRSTCYQRPFELRAPAPRPPKTPNVGGRTSRDGSSTPRRSVDRTGGGGGVSELPLSPTSVGGVASAPGVVTYRFVECPVEARTNVTDDQKVLEDGTRVRRRTETTTFVQPVRVLTRTDGVVTDSTMRDEVVGTDVDVQITETAPGVVEPFGPEVQTTKSEQNFEEVLPDGTPLRRKVVRVVARLKPGGGAGGDDGRLQSPNPGGRKMVSRVVRRVGPDGELIEDLITEEQPDGALSPGSSRRSSIDGWPTSPADSWQLSPTDSELDLTAAFAVYTDFVETEPKVRTDVREYDETLPDSSVVRKRVTTTTESRSIVLRALMPDDEEDAPSTDGGDAPPVVVVRYADGSAPGEPQTVNEVCDCHETLPSGEIVKKRVITKGRRRLATERKLVRGRLDDDQFRDVELLSGLEPDAESQAQHRPDRMRSMSSCSAQDQLSPTTPDESSRLVLRKHVHKKTIIHGDREETLVTETTHVEQDTAPPPDMSASIDAVIKQFMTDESFDAPPPADESQDEDPQHQQQQQ